MSKILNKDQIERRDHYKKQKELDDLINIFVEYSENQNLKIVFVCDSYK